MKKRTNELRDSPFFRCLFHFLDRHGKRIKQVHVLKPNVFLLNVGEEHLILKKYGSFKKLQEQMTLMQKLPQYQFNQAFQFDQSLPIFEFDGKKYAFQKYIFPSDSFFHFQSFSNREDGLLLLFKLHQCTSKILQDFPEDFPLQHHNLIEKWEYRIWDFKRNIPILREFTSPSALESLVELGYTSLEGMKRKKAFYGGRKAIIHGDVASHNFIMGKDGLHLIDFDLLEIAPPMVDYLQFANRILPFSYFNLNNLQEHAVLKKQIENPFFLYALIYPTDIFREWNRLVHDYSIQDPYKIQSMKSVTENELQYRMFFAKQILTKLKNK